jgi:hypothetical protein
MSLPFDLERIRAYELEFGAGGQRLGCKFRLDHGSLPFVHEFQITPEIESFISSFGSPTVGWPLNAGRPEWLSPALTSRDVIGTRPAFKTFFEAKIGYFIVMIDGAKSAAGGH